MGMTTTLSSAPQRLLIAGPNLTIDRTATIAALRPGEVLRTREVAVTAGGKGVNVARAASALGATAVLVGFLPGRLGGVAAALLADEGVALRGIDSGGELRSTSVLIEDGGRVTVINEPGPAVTATEWAALERAVAEGLRGAAVLVCSGSIPPGAPPDAFGRLVTAAHAAGVRALVDTSSVQLGSALAAGPDVATPNLAEAEALLGGGAGEGVEVAGDTAKGRALDAADGLVRLGARAAVVTAGAAGAAIVGEEVRSWLPAPAVLVRNPIGAGDAFAAGLAVGLARGESLADATALAVATGSASVELWLAGAADPTRVAELLAGGTTAAPGWSR
jgi:1-phosphofructokinase family hexose kinase